MTRYDMRREITGYDIRTERTRDENIDDRI